MKEGKITLSQEQLKTLTVINRFIDKSISRQQAAELLGLSTRQITRLKKGVLTSGAQSLIHKNTGRKPVHSVSDELKEAVLKIYSRPEFSNANFLHFKDILSADFGIQLSYSALSSILKNAGFDTAHIGANVSPIPDSSSRSMPRLTSGLGEISNTPFMVLSMMLPGRSSDFS